MTRRTILSSRDSCHSQSLAAYLTGTLGGALLLGAPQAEAAVTSVTFGFGSVLDAMDGSSYTVPTTPSFGTIPMMVSQFYMGDPYMGAGPSLTVFRIGETLPMYGHFYQQGPAIGNGFGIGVPTCLADGAVVGSGGNGVLGMAYFSSDDPSRDVPFDQLNQNLAFFTSTGNWGWLNASWDATAKALSINAAYVESVTGQPITVGDTGVSPVPEPGSALLALAGLGGYGPAPQTPAQAGGVRDAVLRQSDETPLAVAERA